ncbi:LysR family transcriptional regulator [Kordiimonas sp. A6E486]|nr:LysR family transcriptional regulator [Kordiimonas marina]
MKSGTVTEAANRLGITQPAVTASLKQIEATIGFNLFHRTGGRLHPTAEAKLLYGEAERIQDSLTVFRSLAERLKTDLTSHLRIAAPPALSHELIPEAITRFLGRPHSCMIDVTTQHHAQILNGLTASAGQNYLGFTFGMEETPGVGSLTVGKVQLVAVVPTGSPLLEQEKLSLEALTAHPLVGTFSGEPLGNAVERLMDEAGVTPRYLVRVHNHNVAANLAAKGVGAAIIDSVTAAYAAACFGAGNFAIRPIEAAPELPVTAVYSYEHPLNSHAKQFLSVFRTCLETVPAY